MKTLFDNVSFEASRITTKAYSTSFSMGIRFLHKEIRQHVYAIYGFVRFADEIVDTFHDYPKAELFYRFKEDTYRSIEERISMNPILNAFQHAVHRYNIDRTLIDTFLRSMEMDLDKSVYNLKGYEEYIDGSAEVVGLMCLKVFCYGDETLYNKTKANARSLGAAFQKINFLRDLKADFEELGRSYFPGVDLTAFDASTKKKIEDEIEKDFQHGFEGIKMLPKSSRFGVYVAYVYYYRLFKKIRNAAPEKVMSTRIRIPNQYKYALFAKSYVKHSFNIL